MTLSQITISPHKRAAGRFIASVRRAILKALAEEHAERGLTQSDIARELNVHRSVISRELKGISDISVGRIGEFAHVFGRKPTFALPKKAIRDGVNIKALPSVNGSTNAGQMQIGATELASPKTDTPKSSVKFRVLEAA